MMTLAGHNTSADPGRETATVFFGSGASSLVSSQSESYFAYCGREITRISIRQQRSPTQDVERTSELQSKIVQTWKTISTRRTEPKREMVHHLRSLFHEENDTSISDYIDLTVRLWLMLNVRSTNTLVRVPPKRSICWDMGASLEDVIKTQFTVPGLVVQSSRRRIDPSFTAVNMVRLCGLLLRWTDSLEDHLRLDRRSKEPHIFGYKWFLNAHLEADQEHSAAARYLN